MPEPRLITDPGAFRYNEVRQKSSHNSYEKEISIEDQVEKYFFQSLELDLHHGKPIDYPHNWFIYHRYFPAWFLPVLSALKLNHLVESNVRTLADAIEILIEIRAHHQHEVLTIFLDVQDPFDTPGGLHTPEDLDNILGRLGDAVFTPGDLIKARSTATLFEAVRSDMGWPTLRELRNKVIFVLTGSSLSEVLGSDGDSSILGSYVAGPAAARRKAFLAPELSSVDDLVAVQNVLGANNGALNDIIFYNMALDNATMGHQIYDLDVVSRVFGVEAKEDDWEIVRRSKNHIIATDAIVPGALFKSPGVATGLPFEQLSDRVILYEKPFLVRTLQPSPDQQS